MRGNRQLLALLLAGLAACKGQSEGISLSKASLSEETDELPNLPVPAENGPKLAALVAEVPVLERPKKDAAVIGTLLVGQGVARSAEPYKRTALCEGGYYPVRPRGFVCLSSDLTLEVGDAPKAPDLAQVLPYRYASMQSAAPLYNRLPTPAEQSENEPDLSKHLARASKGRDKPMRAGAIDIPTDERGVATGPAAIAKEGMGVAADGNRTADSFFQFGDHQRPVVLANRASLPIVASVARKGTALAIVGAFDHEGPEGVRRFGQTPGGLFVAIDRLDPELGAGFHGVGLVKGDDSLPVAFALRHETCPYDLGGRTPVRLSDDEVERRSVINLTGRFRTVNGTRYDEAEGDVWFRDRDLVKVVKRSKFPDFVTDSTHWLDVSLALQTLTIYEGRKPVYATLISSGQDVLGDPQTSAASLQGTFTLQKKSITMALDPREVGDAYDVQDAPFSLEYAPGFSIVGNYWNDPVGEARGFHNVALAPLDARRLFLWAGPEVPSGFRSIVPLPEETIIVSVRK